MATLTHYLLGTPAEQLQSPNQYDHMNRMHRSDTALTLRANAKHTITSEHQREAKRGKLQNRTDCLSDETSPDLQANTGRTTAAATRKDETPKLVKQETELHIDPAMSSFTDSEGCEEISGVRIMEMLALLRLNGTCQRSQLS